MNMSMKLMAMTAMLGMAMGCKMSHNTTDPAGRGTTKEATMPQGRLIEVEYDYQGMVMEMIGSPRLFRSEGKAMLSFRLMGGEEETHEVSDTLFDAARTIIEEERMYAYGSSYKISSPFVEVLDGYSWHFEAVFEGGEHLSSGGSNVRPEGQGLSRISKLLTEAAEQFVKFDED